MNRAALADRTTGCVNKKRNNEFHICISSNKFVKWETFNLFANGIYNICRHIVVCLSLLNPAVKNETTCKRDRQITLNLNSFFCVFVYVSIHCGKPR